MLDLLWFDIKDDHIDTRTGHFFFFEVKPPNFSTLDKTDCELYYHQFEQLMRSTNDFPFGFCALDKTVSLSKNREYIAGLDGRYDKQLQDILEDLNRMEDVSGNTQRGYYYFFFCKSPGMADRFEAILKANGTECSRAQRNELITLMRSFNLREFVDDSVFMLPDEEPLLYGKKKIAVSPLLGKLLPTQLSFQADLRHVVQTNFLRKAFVVRNLPQRIDSNRVLLRKILQLPNTTVTVRLSSLSYAETKKLVDQQFNNSHSGMFRSKMTEVLEAKDDAAKLQEFYQGCLEHATEGGSVKVVNIYMETYGNTATHLEENIQHLTDTCERYGVTIEDFVFRQDKGFLGVYPLGYDTRGRLLANKIPCDTLGQLYPFSSSYLNDVTGMALGRTVDHGMIVLDVWQRSLTRTNSNIAIIGFPGMGKSYLSKKIINQQRLMGSHIYILDGENEFGDVTTGMGGVSINCASGRFTINPLQMRPYRSDIENDEDADDVMTGQGKNTFYQHLGWLGDFITVLIPQITTPQLAALKMLIRDVYNKMGIQEETDIAALRPTDFPIFSDVYQYIEDVLAHREKYPFYHMLDLNDLKALLLLLDDLCNGSVSLQFNRHTNVQNCDFINLNIQELLIGSQNNAQAVLFNYLTYIWGKVITREHKIMLVVDELYLLANASNPTILQYLNSFVRRSRKYNASLLVSTQKIMDCLAPEIAQWTSAIFDMPTYKFLFFPGDVDMEIMRNKLNLTSGEIASISFPEKKNCLLKIGKEKYHMTVGTLPFEQQLFGKGGGL